MSEAEVLIVGGGLAGLCCATRLHAAGVSCQILDAADDVGGRARTDQLDGFLLDRGFQVLLTAYPEAKRVLDLAALDLAPFEPGALIRYQGKFHHFVDPWRRPRHLASTALSPVATLADKIRIARLRRRVCRGTLDELLDQPETTTLDALRREGFSDRIINCFFRPFLGGVFLDPELQTSSRMFHFVFRMFSSGNAVLPAAGMGAMARQIASTLPPEVVRSKTAISGIDANSVRLASGDQLSSGNTVLACEAPAAAKILGDQDPASGQAVTCLYFAADKPPIQEPILVLNGDGSGPINNLCVPSQVSASYAPDGQSLVSVTVLGVSDDDSVENQVRAQLVDWFGDVAHQWRHLRSYRIPYALPTQFPPALSPVAKPPARSDGVIVCGDYLDTASIQGAMLSGRRAAESILKTRNS